MLIKQPASRFERALIYLNPDYLQTKHICREKNLQIYSRILTITHDDIGAIAQVQFLYSHIIYYMAHSKGRPVIYYKTEGYTRTIDSAHKKTHYM